jgi:hypothetical protein
MPSGQLPPPPLMQSFGQLSQSSPSSQVPSLSQPTQSGSVAGVQVGPQQPSAGPQAGHVCSQVAEQVPPFRHVSVVQLSPSSQSALIVHVGVVHIPLQQIPPVHDVLSGYGLL